MAIIINIKIKLLPREYTFTINSAAVNRKIKTGLTRTRMSIESSLNIIPIIGPPLKNMFVATVEHLPTVNVTTFKFNDEYIILVNTDKKLAPYIGDLKNTVYQHANNVKDLRSVVVVPSWELEKPDADFKILLISAGEEYSEATEVTSNGKTVKTIIVGEEKLNTLPNLNVDTLSSKGLVLYGDELLKGLSSKNNVEQHESDNKEKHHS